MIAKSMISLLKGVFKKQEDINMNSLREVINDNTTIYFTSELEPAEEPNAN